MRNRNVVVIGGTGGIGKGVVDKFLDEGWNVIYSYCHSKKKADEMEANYNGSQILSGAALDTSNADSLKSFSDKIDNEFASIDALVFCSGIIKDSSFLTMSEDSFNEVIDVNLMGCVRVVKELLPFMNFKEGAGIVAVSSTGGIRPGVGQANYSASKAGIIAFMNSIAREYARKKIRANSVAPGFIDTEMSDKENPKIQKAISEIPMKRLGTASEVAEAVYFLASPEASYVTAQTLIVDGGRI